MANLSNINNKFLVTTGGNVGIGNTSPTLSTLTVGIGSTNSPSQICQLAGSGSGVYSVLSLTNTNGTAADNNGVGLDFHVNAAYSATGRIQLIHPTAQSGTTTNSSMQFLTYGTVSGVTTFSPRMTIDYRGNVGIGTTLPDVGGAGSSYTVLSVIETVGTRRGILELGDNQNADTGGIGSINFVGTYQDAGHKIMAEIRGSASGSTSGQRGSIIQMYTKENGTATIQERMRITSAGAIEIKGTSTTSQAQAFITNDNSVLSIGSSVSGSVVKDIQFNSPSPMMYIDGSTARVGIGTTSPGRGLTIDKSNANAALEIIKNNTGNQIVYLGTGSSGGTDDPLLRMYHNTTENIRLYTTGDSWINGGNLGIGTPSPSGAKLVINDTSDGDKIRLEKSGALVGSVGTYNGVPYIGYQGGAGGGIMFNGASIEPTALGSARSSNTNDIGSATYQWRNAYLGGGIFLGGTASSHKLNYYSSGTWTPTVTSSAGGGFPAYSSIGYYQRVGKVVTASFEFTISNLGTASGTVIINNLPISIASGNGVKTVVGYGSIAVLGQSLSIYHYTALNQIGINKYDGNFAGTTYTTRGTVTYWAEL